MPKKRILYSLLFLLPIIVVICNNKSIINSEKDLHYIDTFATIWKLDTNKERVHRSFETEIEFIRGLQGNVIRSIKHKEIPHRYFGDISYYYTNREGFCYDRAVLMEKVLTRYGFSFRHAYLSFGPVNGSSSILNLVKKSTPSHALFEVKTKKGWMTVDANQGLIGVSPEYNVLNLQDFKKRLKLGHLNLKYPYNDSLAFWNVNGTNFNIIYGLYSRHGEFFSHQSATTTSLLTSFRFLPDYNLRMLLYNF